MLPTECELVGWPSFTSSSIACCFGCLSKEKERKTKEEKEEKEGGRGGKRLLKRERNNAERKRKEKENERVREIWPRVERQRYRERTAAAAAGTHSLPHIRFYIFKRSRTQVCSTQHK